MASISSNLFKGALLDRYYEFRALSECGLAAQFKIVRAGFGTSSLVTKNPTGGWNIANIPPGFQESDFADFAYCDLICSVSGSTMNISATLKDSDLQDNNAHDFNTLVLMDNGDATSGRAPAIVAVLCCQQDSLFRGKSFTALLTIEQKVI